MKILKKNHSPQLNNEKKMKLILKDHEKVLSTFENSLNLQKC